MLTLGRQAVYMPAPKYRSLLESLGITPGPSSFADDFFQGLGATSVISLDASAYENATLIHDLNQPIPDAWAGSYDSVFDGGALEHVFNFPTALRNCMELVKVGGHLIIITTWNNYAGHGFYQFSPELFYAALSPNNGYLIDQMLIVQSNQWYAVANPEAVGGRVQLLNSEPTLLFLTARREKSLPVFSTWPQQSDYSAAWICPASGQTAATIASRWKTKLVDITPGGSAIQKLWRDHKLRKACSPANRLAFRPVDLD